MSIEKLMQELIDALDRNTAALGTGKAPTLEVTEPEDDQALEIETPQWPEIVSAFRCFIARHGTTEAVKIMTEFGIKGKLTEDQLPVARYAEFLQAMKSHGE